MMQAVPLQEKFSRARLSIGASALGARLNKERLLAMKQLIVAVIALGLATPAMAQSSGGTSNSPASNDSTGMSTSGSPPNGMDLSKSGKAHHSRRGHHHRSAMNRSMGDDGTHAAAITPTNNFGSNTSSGSTNNGNLVSGSGGSRSGGR
jgi:hypothetical protein